MWTSIRGVQEMHLTLSVLSFRGTSWRAAFSTLRAPAGAKSQADARLPSRLFLFCGETMGTQQRPSVPHLLEEQAWGKVGAGDLENQSRMTWCRARVKGHMKAQVQGSDFCGCDLGDGELFRSTRPTWATGFLNTDRCCVLVSSTSPKKPSD